MANSGMKRSSYGLSTGRGGSKVINGETQNIGLRAISSVPNSNKDNFSANAGANASTSSNSGSIQGVNQNTQQHQTKRNYTSGSSNKRGGNQRVNSKDQHQIHIDQKSRNVEQLKKKEENYQDQQAVHQCTSAEFSIFVLILVGQEVEIKLKDGTRFCGLFQSLTTKDTGGENCICLQYSRRVLDLDSTELSGKIEQYALFPLNSVHSMVTTNKEGVPTNFNSVSGEVEGSQAEKIAAFKTDTEISKDSNVRVGRTLQPWTDESSLHVSEEILDSTINNEWDQFEVNRIRFGITGTYDENLYTTPLNYDDISEEDRRNAELLALEIEREQRLNELSPEKDTLKKNKYAHDDEEMKYSSVYREEDTKIFRDKQKLKINDLGEQKKDSCNEAIGAKSKNCKQGFSFNPNAKEFQPRSFTGNSYNSSNSNTCNVYLGSSDGNITTQTYRGEQSIQQYARYQVYGEADELIYTNQQMSYDNNYQNGGYYVYNAIGYPQYDGDDGSGVVINSQPIYFVQTTKPGASNSAYYIAENVNSASWNGHYANVATNMNIYSNTGNPQLIYQYSFPTQGSAYYQ
ncbi:uncharacterized protein CMU_023080 [Cryptosporidium muris RN66]|uniref:LsmAD domain-containing protein n=1 Tax=Cryptosporidium muris (strain RN66) TaxID=441375 RepID=B6ABV0_CRYMR|nr:uncharacterized protein CMU_023080 [Cryptosporidium muris RN66]EEA05303.1 hypothetical protein, conserved [Cryptosporidium muris RN66]|eukprot:XP_002139652.1 hypothetical protein [Cryptosporidium muris RN66]